SAGCSAPSGSRSSTVTTSHSPTDERRGGRAGTHRGCALGAGTGCAPARRRITGAGGARAGGGWLGLRRPVAGGRARGAGRGGACRGGERGGVSRGRGAGAAAPGRCRGGGRRTGGNGRGCDRGGGRGACAGALGGRPGVLRR